MGSAISIGCAAARRRALKHPLGTVAAYLADLIRADLAAAGEAVPAAAKAQRSASARGRLIPPPGPL